MALIFGILCVVAWLVSWIFWGVTVSVVFFLAMAIPFFIWEGFMYLTFNNLINAVAKIPTWIGFIIGYLFALPFAIPGLVFMTWCYIQTLFMGILTLAGADSAFATNYINNLQVWEFDNPGIMFIARFYYNHCQWLWGGAGFFRGYYFWQNGVWADACTTDMPVPIMICKLFILCIPYMMMFILPIIPLLWSLFRPLVGAASCLPAVSENGDGRD